MRFPRENEPRNPALRILDKAYQLDDVHVGQFTENVELVCESLG